MPKVRDLKVPNRKLAVIRYCMTFKNWDSKRLEEELNIGKNGRLAREKDVSLFSLSEIQKIVHGVPLSMSQVSDLLGGLQWDFSPLEERLMELYCRN